MKPTLLILAAGMGSRYGGIKQLDQFGPNGETIIDYSLYDAIRAGFGKVVFIIREELRADFEEVFGPKLRGKIDYDYAIQGFQSYVPAELGHVERAKPWGTGHAMLCAWEQTQTPFAVINADDFYGLEAFQLVAEFLTQSTNDSEHTLIAYQLQRTLSENGTVSRGICEVNDEGYLEVVTERLKISEESGIIADRDAGHVLEFEPKTPVSMNFWGFKPSVFPITNGMFTEYALKNYTAPKAEFFIPLVATHLIQRGLGKLKVISNASEWFGVTYPEDKPTVQAALKRLHDEEKYPTQLW
ncbi:MAG: NTP transferase domain-containing protein [Spirosomataceae bacterium]